MDHSLRVSGSGDWQPGKIVLLHEARGLSAKDLGVGRNDVVASVWYAQAAEQSDDAAQNDSMPP